MSAVLPCQRAYAQVASTRNTVYGSEGWGFESLRACNHLCRSACRAFSAEVPRFEQALWSCLFENRDSKSPELKQAWQTLTSRYGEAQIILGNRRKAAADKTVS